MTIRKGIVISVLIVISAGIGLLSANLGVTIHELFLHNLVGWALGCPASSDANIYTGITNFNCDPENGIFNIIIGLSAPLGAFFIGFLLWIWDKDSILRVIGLVIMMYSSIPSLLPWIPGSDMAFAIQNGFNLYVGWVIYIVISGIFYLALTQEIMDTRIVDPNKIPFLVPSRCKGLKGSKLKVCMKRKKS